MELYRKGMAILIGSLLLSIGINFFLVPFELLDGGIIGLGLIVKYLLGIKAGFTIIVLSIPIFYIGWLHYRNYFYSSLHGMLISSFFIDLLYPFHKYFVAVVQLPALISSILGGALVGLGIGIMLRYDTSTGGTDLLAQFLSNIFNINVGFMIFIIDAFVICIGGLLISKETFFLSLIAIISVALTTSLCTWHVAVDSKQERI
ncbi:YitT family protein [Ammoniphilus sp. 3BR4]|uniref:YitT family protein n=1 Tax=Ammoniphilus sp. 3BR4 TaxID=3158265 RepID=UPI003465DCF4